MTFPLQRKSGSSNLRIVVSGLMLSLVLLWIQPDNWTMLHSMIELKCKRFGQGIAKLFTVI